MSPCLRWVPRTVVYVIPYINSSAAGSHPRANGERHRTSLTAPQNGKPTALGAHSWGSCWPTPRIRRDILKTSNEEAKEVPEYGQAPSLTRLPAVPVVGHYAGPLGAVGGPMRGVAFYWLAVQELKLSCHTPETMLFTMYPYYGNLNSVP